LKEKKEQTTINEKAIYFVNVIIETAIGSFINWNMIPDKPLSHVYESEINGVSAEK